MKHGASINSDFRKAALLIFVLLCMLVASGTGWVLFLGAIGGNLLCITGWFFGITMSVSVGYFVSEIGEQK